MPPAAHASTPAIASYTGKRAVKCGENVADPGIMGKQPIDRPNDLSRAPNAAAGNPPLGKDLPGVFFICTKGGGVEQNRTRTRAVPEILHWRTRLNFLAKFFGKKFWK